MTLVSTQSFGIGSPGGGPRILRTLFAGAPTEVVSVCTNPRTPPDSDGYRERHVALRRTMGRLEGTRPGAWVTPVEWGLGTSFGRRLEQVCTDTSATALHAVPHMVDFWHTYRLARRLDLPFLLTVHDDPRYVLHGRPDVGLVLRRLGHVWREADERFVISEAMGREYCREFGEQPYSIVSDGLSADRIADAPRPRAGYRGYFAGLFHLSYAEAVGAFTAGLGRASATGADPVSMTMRCGAIPEGARPHLAGGLEVQVRAFGPEAEVATDMEQADFLYLPLPFDSRHEHFVRLSLSTKLVTYLGAGLPIVYHGPAGSAAHELLSHHDAAICLTTLDPDEIARGIMAGMARADEVTANALALGRSEFTVEEQRRRFWSRVPA